MEIKRFSTALLLLILLISTSCSQKKEEEKYSVTFIEVGAERCIPCKKMQAVVKQVDEKYPGAVKTVFYDVWTKEGKTRAEKYHVDLIPTQIFLDKNGKEYFRHVGYFPFEDLERILQQKLN